MKIRNPQSEIRNLKSEISARPAYSLVELLVVIAVIILLLAVAVPGIGKMMRAGRQDAAISSFSAATALARSYAGRSPPFQVGEYQGTAIVVTPSNELRIVEHFEQARYDTGTNRLVQDGYAGYRDIGRGGDLNDVREQYVTIPDGVGVVGITRGPGGLKLLAPPFALRFDRYGHLIVRDSGLGGEPVVYNGNFATFDAVTHNGYEPGNVRYDGYDPADVDNCYDPEISGKTATNFDTARGVFKLPFDSLETVIGVVSYSKKDFKDMGYNLECDGTGLLKNNVAHTWLLNNGRVIFFNRYSGAVIKP